MKSIVFPYGIRFQEDGKIATFPAAQGRLRGEQPAETIYGVFLIDSGATTSVLPASDAEVLGVRLHKGTKVVVRGIGATDYVGYKHTVICILETGSFNLPVVFIDHPATLRVFGREGLFDKFLILFDELKQRTIFLSPGERKNINTLIK